MSTNLRVKLMMFAAISLGVFAILWGLAPYPSVNLPARLILDISDWPLDNFANPLDKNTMWISSIGAGLLGMVAILLGGIAIPAIKNRDENSAKTIIWATIFWYIVDGVGSVAAGVPSNVFFNSIYLLLIIVPLIGIGKDNIIST